MTMKNKYIMSSVNMIVAYIPFDLYIIRTEYLKQPKIWNNITPQVKNKIGRPMARLNLHVSHWVESSSSEKLA